MAQRPVTARLATMLGITAGGVVVGDLLFYDAPVGWTAAAFTAALAGVATLRSGPTRRAWPFRLIAVGTLLAAGAMVLQPGALEYALAGLGLAALAIVGRGGGTASVVTWARRLGAAALLGWTTPFVDAGRWNRWVRRHPDSRIRLAATVALWGVPLALGGVFVALLVAANPVIERWLGDALDAAASWAEGFPAARLGLWVALAGGVWTLMRLRGRRGAAEPVAGDPRLARAQAAVHRFVGGSVLLRCLILFNAIFAVQTAMDLRYLWAGGGLPEGITFAQYAHRGAYPLLATTLLAVAFVVVAFRATPDEARTRWSRRLVYLWLAQNLGLMISAVRRLDLYVDVYSLTRLRVAAAIWMGFVAALLVLLVFRIAARRDNRWLLQAAAVAAIAVCVSASYVNFDAFIARYNARHAAAILGPGTPDAPRSALDVDYLQRLGPESLPALRWYLDRAPDAPPAADARHAIARLEADLDRDLADWRGWTWRRHRLAAEAPTPAPTPTPVPTLAERR